MSDEPHDPKPPTRRGLLRLGGFAALVGAVYGGTSLLQRLTEPALEFEPLKGVPGFRWVEGGPISGGSTIMVGIGAGDQAAEPLPQISNRALCLSLFGPAPDPSKIQIAYFTDYRCYYCRTVSPMMAQMHDAGEVQVTWHDLPLLGQVSSLAARAAVAAREQGAYHLFHDRLMGTSVVPTPPFLRALSREAGIDAARLLRDMQSSGIEKQLATTAAIAQRFGFIGTPALVVGRTAVLGGVDRRMVDRLIAAERAAGDTSVC